MLKLDFEKAYDTVEWECIVETLQALGVNSTWISWIKLWLSSAKESTLVNDIQGKEISGKRGLSDVGERSREFRPNSGPDPGPRSLLIDRKKPAKDSDRPPDNREGAKKSKGHRSTTQSTDQKKKA